MNKIRIHILNKIKKLERVWKHKLFVLFRQNKNRCNISKHQEKRCKFIITDCNSIKCLSWKKHSTKWRFYKYKNRTHMAPMYLLGGWCILPFFILTLCWWILTSVVSILRFLQSASVLKVLKRSSSMPSLHHLQKRL